MPPGLITAAQVLGVPFLGGINLYLTVFVLGLVARFGGGVLGPEFDPFAAWPVIVAAGILTVIEFIADKVPAVDHAWDAIHTFVRVPAGMVVAGIIASGNEPYWVVIAVLVGGAVSFTAHSTKSTLRLTSTKTTAAQANAAISLGEDIFVAVGAVLAAFSPILLAAVVVVALVVIFAAGPKVVRSLKINLLLFYNWVAFLYVRARRFFQSDWEPLPDPLPLPRKLAVIVESEPPRSAARVIIGRFTRRRLGWLFLWPDRFMVVRQSLFRKGTKTYKWAEVKSLDFDSGWLCDKISVSVGRRGYTIMFFKGRTPYAEDVFVEMSKLTRAAA